MLYAQIHNTATVMLWLGGMIFVVPAKAFSSDQSKEQQFSETLLRKKPDLNVGMNWNMSQA